MILKSETGLDRDTLIGRLCWLFLALFAVLNIVLIKNCPQPGTILAEALDIVDIDKKTTMTPDHAL